MLPRPHTAGGCAANLIPAGQRCTARAPNQLDWLGWWERPGSPQPAASAPGPWQAGDGTSTVGTSRCTSVISRVAAGVTPKPHIFLSYLKRLLKTKPWVPGKA